MVYCMQQLGSQPSSSDGQSTATKLPQLPLPVIETNSIKVLCGSLPFGPVTGMYHVLSPSYTGITAIVQVSCSITLTHRRNCHCPVVPYSITLIHWLNDHCPGVPCSITLIHWLNDHCPGVMFYHPHTGIMAIVQVYHVLSPSYTGWMTIVQVSCSITLTHRRNGHCPGVPCSITLTHRRNSHCSGVPCSITLIHWLNDHCPGVMFYHPHTPVE